MTKAAEFWARLQPLVDIGIAVAGAMDNMGIGLAMVGEVFKALPGIGQLIRFLKRFSKSLVSCSTTRQLVVRNLG